MAHRLRAALIVGAALLLLVPPAHAAPLGGTDPPPLCHVERAAAPGPVPGVYTVTIRTVPECPPDGYAWVRLESGRIYPWRIVTPGQRVTYKGIPWWWRGAWRAASGVVYRFKIPGMRPPWEAP